MKNSETYENIKIPYPTEGVIRTAALDDTIAPEDSVQVAVNMNFDRIGAMQTRKGVSEYADELLEPIKNFGTLNNSITPTGYDRLVKLNPTDSFAGTAGDKAVAKIDDTHFIIFWSGEDVDGFVQVVEADLDTGEITPLGTPLEFDITVMRDVACIMIDANHFLAFWQGSGADGFAQVFTVNLTSWEVTAEGTPLEFDVTDNRYNSCAQIDANHFINFWAQAGGDGFAQVFEVNLGTWAVTNPAAVFTFDATSAFYNSCHSLGDGIHFINFWYRNGTSGFAQVFTVNTGTWEITAEGSSFAFGTSATFYISAASLGDGEHFIAFWTGDDTDGFTQVFEVDPGTFAVSLAGNLLEFSTDSVRYNSAISLGDGEHFVNFWRELGNIGMGQIFEVDLTTFDIDAVGYPVTYGSVSDQEEKFAPVLATSSRVLNFWTVGVAGAGSVFRLEGFPESFNWLYAQRGDGDVLNWDNPGWTVRRTGVNPQQKARFAQYLGVIWMVNGNASFGDPVMTSDGGDFSEDMVPDGFPPGDFIQAGFAGRVWVADALNDIVYYTDVVQFTPPDIYTLTFNIETNFIRSFSSQNGQKMTALFVTPRALLLFKEDSIYRIYGASSVDNYPAYNVGTFSQESIVQTKEGIYFHHSSGFYKFAYDSQPIEISRRVIDFIEAIPRAYYPEVKGIYNGVDAIEWHVGPLTVEGVLYKSCVMRYTISTEVWTIYDYHQNNITALIRYDDGENINMIVGASIT